METFYAKGVRLSTKLTGAALVFFAMLAFSGGIGLYNMHNIKGYSEKALAVMDDAAAKRRFDDQELLDNFRQSYAGIQSSYKTALILTAVIGIAALVVIFGLGYYLARTLTGPLNKLVMAMQRVSEGDLTATIAIDSERRDEIAEASGALNILVDELNTSLQKVAMAAGVVYTGSQELSSAAVQLSSSSQEQASSLEETAASMEEMTSTVKHNADNALQADKLALESSEVADEGVVMAASITRSMDLISSSSKRIADIIGVIDGIAFQTNLLALNAAVEAARAGEHGKGFAVVAAEVRNLAQRSATAAKEIKELIQDSLDKVGDGAHLVSISGTKLQVIVTKVKQVAGLISEISASSQEQASGIEQVNRAIVQMDSVTQSNAAQVEELSGTSQSLSSQAEYMKEMVSHFMLNPNMFVQPLKPTSPSSANPKTNQPQTQHVEISPVARVEQFQQNDGAVKNNAQAAPPRRANAGGAAASSKDDWTEF